jgi:hypothetical protein
MGIRLIKIAPEDKELLRQFIVEEGRKNSRRSNALFEIRRCSRGTAQRTGHQVELLGALVLFPERPDRLRGYHDV